MPGGSDIYPVYGGQDRTEVFNNVGRDCDDIRHSYSSVHFPHERERGFGKSPSYALCTRLTNQFEK